MLFLDEQDIQKDAELIYYAILKMTNRNDEDMKHIANDGNYLPVWIRRNNYIYQIMKVYGARKEYVLWSYVRLHIAKWVSDNAK